MKTARIRWEFRRLYPGLSAEWHPVVSQDDLMIRLDLGNGKTLAVDRNHVELREGKP